MNTVSPRRKAIPVPAIVAVAIALGVIVAAAVYLYRTPDHSRASTASAPQASAEAKAYVGNLQLSDVTMQATENFMKQQVVEVQGNIANRGQRPLRTVDVYCLFQDVSGRQIARERLPIVQSKGNPLRPGEVRSFRLPFDTIPDGWNQAMPRMVIAQITFAQ